MGRKLAGITLVVAMLVTWALPAWAWQAEGGYKNCGLLIAFAHGRYNDIVAITGPGGSTGYYLENDNSWHVRERNGSYSGDWQVLGDPYLDLGQTWAGCRSYG